MSFDDFYQRFVAFGLTFALSLLAAAFLYGFNFSDIFRRESKPAAKIIFSTNNGIESSNHGGKGASSRRGNGDSERDEKPAEFAPSNATGIKILSKPHANYTEEARANNIQGTVILRVTFLANGEIGAILTFSGLPDGLTEQAINAAKGIKFEPAKRDGKPATVTKMVEYNFTIY